MERLDKYPSYDLGIPEHFEPIHADILFSKYQFSTQGGLPREIAHIRNYLYSICSPRRVRWDLRDANIMLRGKQVVITDPIA